MAISTIGTNGIEDGAIVAADIASGAVTQAKLGTNVTGTGPAFSAYANTGSSLTSSAFSKITYDVENFDTNNNFASSRFTPTVAGYYQINAHTSVNGAVGGNNVISIFKNGSEAMRGCGGLATNPYYFCASGLIYCNGSTDYIEIYLYQSSGSTQTSGTGTYIQFNGALVRSA